VSIKVSRQCWLVDLPTTDKCVYLALADHADDDATCFPSVGYIAWKTGMTERGARKIISRFRDLNLIRAIGNEEGGRGRATVYRITPENGRQLPAFRSKNPGRDTSVLAENPDTDDRLSMEERGNHGSSFTEHKGGTAKHKRGNRKALKGEPRFLPTIINPKEPSVNSSNRKNRDSQNPAYELFADSFLKSREIPYQSKKGDFVQLTILRKRVKDNGNGLPERWEIAVGNYFASVLSSFTMADLCVRYDTFIKSPLDRYGKPPMDQEEISLRERFFGKQQGEDSNGLDLLPDTGTLRGNPKLIAEERARRAREGR